MKLDNGNTNKQSINQFYRTSLHVAFFALISYAVDYSFQLVDIYWVSHLGVGAPTALAIVSSIFFLILSFNEVIGVSTVAIFAQRYGQADKRRTGESVLQALLLKLALGCLSAIVFLLIIRFGLSLYDLSETEQRYVREYAGIIWLSLLLVPVYSTMMTAMRTVGWAHYTSYISVVALLINVIVNPVLIFGYGPAPALGIAGAAWATVMAQLVALLCCYGVMQSRRFPVPVFSLAFLVWQPQLVWRFLSIGLPIGGVILLYNLEQVILTAFLAEFGARVSDGYGIGARLFGLLFMLNFGIGLGVSVAVGHAIGSGKESLIRHCVPRLSFLAGVILAGLALLLYFSAGPLLRAFTQDPLTVQTGLTYLRFMAFTNVALGVMYCFNGVFEGAGRNGPPLFIASVIYLGFEFPLLFALRGWGSADLTGIWLTVVATYTIGAALTARQFGRGGWCLARTV